MKTIFKNVFGKIAIIACVLCTVLYIDEPISSYAMVGACIDEDNDHYCDVCGKTMEDDILVDETNPTEHHTHKGSASYYGGCYTQPRWVWRGGHDGRHVDGGHYTTHSHTGSCVKTYSDYGNCNGAKNSGWVATTYYSHSMVSSTVTCPTCGGRGYTGTMGSARCGNCGGGGSVSQSKCSRCGSTGGGNCNVKTAGHYTSHSHTSSCVRTWDTYDNCNNSINSGWVDDYTSCTTCNPSYTVGQTASTGCGYYVYDLTCGLNENPVHIGCFKLYKNGTRLYTTVDEIDCTVTGYLWKYNNEEISTDTSIEITSLGTYTCTVSYACNHNTDYAVNTTTLVYNASFDALNISTDNIAHIIKDPTDNSYVLSVMFNADYTSYFTIDSYKWSSLDNAQTWIKLPTATRDGNTYKITTQNCADYSCKIVVKGNDNSNHTMVVKYNITEFDAKIAANIIGSDDTLKDTFSTVYDYYSIQNMYGQAEKITVSNKYKNTVVYQTPIMIFDENHELKDTETVESKVKTYSGINYSTHEIIVYECDFIVSDYKPGTCTKKGTSTIAATIMAKTYFKNGDNGELFFSYETPVTAQSVKDVSKNLKNHDCEIKNYEWKDNDGDNISDYLYITRNCPAANGNWLITIDLWKKQSDEINNDLVEINHENDVHATFDKCSTIKTTVKYEHIMDQFVTYEVIEEANHKYKSEFTPSDCLHAAHRDYECETCGHKYTEETAPPLGHSYVWKTTKYMTMEEDGISTGTCTRCGHVTTKVIESVNRTLQTRRAFNIIAFDPSIYEKDINSKDPWNRTQYYWDLLGLYKNPGDNRRPWEWNGDIGKYVWNGTDNPWEWKSAIGRYSFMTDETLWEWDSDIGKYVWNGEGDEYSFGAGIRIGNGLIPRFDGLSLLSKNGDSNPMDLSITSYEPKEDEKETLLDKLKDVIRDIMNALRNLINFFREHPVLAVVSILLFILIVVGIVLYVLVKKDRIKFKKK